MKMKLNFCEKKARKPLVSLQKNIAEHFSSAMMSLHYKKDRVCNLRPLLLGSTFSKDIP